VRQDAPVMDIGREARELDADKFVCVPCVHDSLQETIGSCAT
jgi:hypothetical protein